MRRADRPLFVVDAFGPWDPDGPSGSPHITQNPFGWQAIRANIVAGRPVGMRRSALADQGPHCPRQSDCGKLRTSQAVANAAWRSLRRGDKTLRLLVFRRTHRRAQGPKDRSSV